MVLLGTTTLDGKALQRLESEATAISGKIDALTTRCSLLAGQVEEALTAEAAERVTEIEAEVAAVVLRINERRAIGVEFVSQLVKLIAEDYPDREHQQTLQGESRFLHEQYGVSYAQAPASHALSSKDLLPLEEAFRKSQRLVTSHSEWDEKTETLLRQRHAAAARAANAHRREQAARLTVR